MEKVELILKRHTDLTKEYTEGQLLQIIDGEFFHVCDTLEDKVRDLNKNGKFDGDEKKIYGETAIPYDKYEIIVTYSPKFKRKMVLVVGVSEFEGIRMHWARTAKQLLGCVGVGKKSSPGILSNSGMTDKLVKLIEGNEATLEII